MAELEKYIVGHKHTLTNIGRMLNGNKFPISSLLVGPASTGKSTLARCIALKLIGVTDPAVFDGELAKLNAGKETVRIKQFNLSSIDDSELARLLSEWVSPLDNGKKVLILDEVHNMKPSVQESILRHVEYGVPNTYSILCTTNLSNLKDSFISRNYRFNMYALSEAEVTSVLRQYLRVKGICFEGVNSDLFLALLKQTGVTIRGSKIILDSLPANHTVTQSDLSMFNTTFDIAVYECIIKSFYTQPLTGITMLKGLIVDGIFKKVLVDLLVLLLGGQDFELLSRSMADKLISLFFDKDKTEFIAFLGDALLCDDATKLISIYVKYSLKSKKIDTSSKELAIAETVNNVLVPKPESAMHQTLFEDAFRKE